MPSAEYDLMYLEAGIKLLEDYLLSNEVYWSLGISPPRGEPSYPPLTLSGMELALLRVRAQPLNDNQQAQVARIAEQLDAARSRWRTAWGKKASDEFRARLTLWRNFLDEYRQDADANFDRYAYEVTRLVQLQLLEPDADILSPAETEMLNGMDKFLRAAFVPGNFVWDPVLQNSFPADPFWYLYGHLKQS